jgi:hypothetical protein
MTSTHNNLNELISQQGGSGPVRFKGSVSEPAIVFRFWSDHDIPLWFKGFREKLTPKQTYGSLFDRPNSFLGFTLNCLCVVSLHAASEPLCHPRQCVSRDSPMS